MIENTDADKIAGVVLWTWMILLSIFGGVVSYLQKLAYGHKFSWVIFLSEIATSAFVGVLTFLLCDEANFSLEITAALIGISGHMGTRALYKIEKFRDRLLGEEHENKSGRS